MTSVGNEYYRLARVETCDAVRGGDGFMCAVRLVDVKACECMRCLDWRMVRVFSWMESTRRMVL